MVQSVGMGPIYCLALKGSAPGERGGSGNVPRLILFLAIDSLLAWVPPAPAASPAAEDWAIFDKPGKFITALCATDEALWVGTEDRSLWRLELKADPAKAEAWQQFTSKDTATDHVYGIAIDSLGRIWVGTLNQGVSVFNGKEWRNYGVLDGCSGERVFAIAADKEPKRGNVWIGTDHGLTCWSPDLTASPQDAKGKWLTYTQADGLPSQQVYAVAVTPAGRVWAGTECDGLAWSDPPYKRWSCIRAAAERSGDAGEGPRLFGGTAPGLPSNLTNDLVVLPNETLVVSTNYGLGVGNAGGQTWTAWQGLSKQPYENYMRGLAVDRSGSLWIGTRHKGLARMDLGTGKVKTYQQPTIPDNYVFAVATTPSGDIWAGTYGGGLARLKGAVPRTSKPGSLAETASANPKSEFRNPKSAPPLPAPQGPPTLDELNAMLADLAEVPFVPPERQPAVIRLDDDWLTKGDWLGRYGRYWACICATCAPHDYLWGAGPQRVEYHAMVGPNRRDGDTLRYWIHWQYTSNPNSLELPPVYLHSRIMRNLTAWDVCRRQSEWDDHAETYPMAQDGLGLYCTIRIPAGLYYLSLYNFNKDGHLYNNRFRDYQISVRLHRTGRPLWSIEGFDRRPEVGRGRLRDFGAGVYKRFLVHGPTEITVHLNRNHSFNTILAGAFLDLVEERPVPYFCTLEEWQGLCAEREKERQALAAESRSPAARGRRFEASQSDGDAARRLLEETERMRLTNDAWWARHSRPVYAAVLRWMLDRLRNTQVGPERERLYARAAMCLHHLGMFEKWEAGQTLLGLTTARQIERSLRWDGLHDYGGKGYDTILSQTRIQGMRRPNEESCSDPPDRCELGIQRP